MTSACAGTSELVDYARSQFGLANGTPAPAGINTSNTQIAIVPAPLATARVQSVADRVPPAAVQVPHASPSSAQGSIVPAWLTEVSGMGMLTLGMMAVFASGIVVLSVPRRK